MALPRGKDTLADTAYTKTSRLKAIETHYNGHRFRSRTEARWAVALDNLGIEYEYEAEGYNLDGLNYLPDFYLPKEDCFIEIKGGPPTEHDWDKAGRLAHASKKYVNILSGQPGRHTLTFARPKLPAPDALLDWLAATPDQHMRRRAIEPYVHSYAFPEVFINALLGHADHVAELRGKALATYGRHTRNNTHYYDFDYCPHHQRLMLWHVWYGLSLAKTGPYENERYGFSLRELVKAGEPYILGSGQRIGLGAHSHFEGDRPIPHSSEWLGALAAARSARFEYGQTPRP